MNTYAAASKVVTNANQFSLRLDHQLSDKSQLMARFNFNNLFGPTTNPDQTAIEPSFGVTYMDHQRNGIVTYTRTVSPHFTSQSSISFTRTTPQFPTPNHTDPAVKFNDGLYEGFNTAGGSVMSAYGNLFQGQQNFTIIAGKHAIKTGGELRLNRDTTYFGISPNGEYDFGGGTAYSPVDIPSQSGMNNIKAGQALPDTLSALLTGRPFVYTVAVAPPYTSGGYHIGPAAISRNAGGVYAQDTWKVSDRFVIDYGIRWEIYSPITERAKRTSGFLEVNPPAGQLQQYLDNPQPGYKTNLDSFGPRVQVDWRVTGTLHVHAGGGITTIPPNIWQDNFLTGAVPFTIYPHLTTSQKAPINYGFQITSGELPNFYTPTGQNVFASGKTNTVPANTVLDVERYQRDLAELSPGTQLTPLNLTGIDRRFGNGYLQTWTLGVERAFGKMTADAAYIGTAAVRLPRSYFPNGYSGAGAGFAPFTLFGPDGEAIGGFGTEQVIEGTAHSSYNALQTSLQGAIVQNGPTIQASYTFSKSLDDTSGLNPNGNATGAVSIPFPQNPFNTHPEKGPSAFDVANGFTLSAAQDLQIEKAQFLAVSSSKNHPGLDAAQHLQHLERCPFHHLLRHPANRSRLKRRRSPQPDRHPASLHRPQGPRRLLRNGRQQRLLLLHSHQPARRHRPQLRLLRHARPQHLPRPRLLRLRLLAHQGHPSRQPLQRRRTLRRPVPLRVFQPLQHREHGPAHKHHPRLRLRPDQPNRRNLPPDSVLAEDSLLRISPPRNRWVTRHVGNTGTVGHFSNLLRPGKVRARFSVQVLTRKASPDLNECVALNRPSTDTLRFYLFPMYR